MAYKIVRRDGVFGDSSLPGMPPIVNVDVIGGLQVITPTEKPAVVGALQLLSTNQTSPVGVDPLMGDLSYVLFSVGSTWLKDLVDQGLVVLVSYPISATPKMIGTKTPAIITQYATPAGGYAIVDGPTSVITAATGAKLTVDPEPSGACPSGYVLNLDTNQCEPPEQGAVVYGPDGQPVTTAVVQSQPTTTPTWVWPVLIGGVALVLVGAAVVNKPKRSGVYAMNRRVRTGHPGDRDRALLLDRYMVSIFNRAMWGEETAEDRKKYLKYEKEAKQIMARSGRDSRAGTAAQGVLNLARSVRRYVRSH